MISVEEYRKAQKSDEETGLIMDRLEACSGDPFEVASKCGLFLYKTLSDMSPRVVK